MQRYYPYLPIPLRLSYLRKKAGVNPLIVNYHMVSDDDLAHVRNLYPYRNTHQFKRDLELFRSRYRVVGLPDLMHSLVPGGVPLPANALILTFDDGFREVYETAAPLLLEYSFPATVFITTSFLDNKNLNHDNKQSLIVDRLKKINNPVLNRKIESMLNDIGISGENLIDRIQQIPYKKRSLLDKIAGILEIDFNRFLEEKQPYLTTDQVTSLISSGFTIGAHSIDHARFSELSLEEQIGQIRTSLSFLVERFSLQYRFFAFPYSDRGVTNACFKSVAGDLDLSFGTHGLKKDHLKTHYQRISVEKYHQPAIRTLKYHYSRGILLHRIQKEYIRRKDS